MLLNSVHSHFANYRLWKPGQKLLSLLSVDTSWCSSPRFIRYSKRAFSPCVRTCWWCPTEFILAYRFYGLTLNSRGLPNQIPFDPITFAMTLKRGVQHCSCHPKLGLTIHRWPINSVEIWSASTEPSLSVAEPALKTSQLSPTQKSFIKSQHLSLFH